MSEQLTLGVQLEDNASFENFYPAKNTQVLASVREMARGRGEHYLLLWGKQGAGCSHLLQAACRETASIGLPAMYLDMACLAACGSVDAFDNLEALHLVCLDNIDALAGQDDWEEALFHFFNRMRESGHRLIMSLHQAPKNVLFRLADLRSRLSWGVVYQLHALDEEEKKKALYFRAEHRGFTLSEPVADYLLRHCQRDMATLANILDQLDQASLSAQRKLTVPFVKSVLGL
ncbi:MAG: DnaA regulatory inactivator Hda [Gammaproteobacteria bacterium CG11_big_fil_rev_8_21_14_0_20_46_22]|nr:MAG: DnaA regulatory inactivator Hda [Gammaproteobacteria bacterium CG12_big_fil_rev_8_21_14_0_65_46_12]PIR11529.1 MAG: DnaA regulatory inactivator Hda [Gammaproteobacteria bacterium CG11_big_fil_rev_8_21_14_0_20_46_22]